MRRSLRICGLVISFSLLLAVGSAQIAFKLSPDHTRVFAGEDAGLYLTLKNNGAKSLSNVVISVDLPRALGGQRNFTLNSLSAGATYSRTVQIITYDSTALGNYSVNATVSYGGESIAYPGVTVEVTKFPVSLYYYFLKQNMKAGEKNSLIVSVKNVGSDTLSSLSVNLDYPGGFITNMSRNLYIPEVVPNLELKQEFEFIAPADANGDYHVGLSVDFKDARGALHSVQRYAKVGVAGAPTLNWLETLLTIMIVILIGLVLLGMAK